MTDALPAAANDNEIEVPYLPRHAARRSAPRLEQALAVHVLHHRRAGKTVAIANHLIRAASRNTRKWPPPRYAYVGPSFDQAKDLVWSYLKQYTEKVPGARYLEGDLACVLPTGATIKLYGGAAAYERMRGMYFDGIALDEYPLLNPAVFSTVVRPCLADYGGFAPDQRHLKRRRPLQPAAATRNEDQTRAGTSIHHPPKRDRRGGAEQGGGGRARPGHEPGRIF